MYKITINNQIKGNFREDDIQGISEKVIEALNKGGKQIYIEEVKENDKLEN